MVKNNLNLLNNHFYRDIFMELQFLLKIFVDKKEILKLTF